MRYKMDIVLDGPVDMVWEAREKRFENPDKFPEIQKHDELERREEGRKLFTKRRMELASKVPRPLRRFMKEEMLNMIDHSEYDMETGEHRWKYVPEAGSDFFSCKGYSKYTEFEEGGEKKTRRKLEVEVKVTVPILGNIAEQFILDIIKKNLKKDTASIQKMLRIMKEEQGGEQGNA